MNDKSPCVYILTNKKNGALYTGVTSHLVKRIWQHKNKVVKGFTEKYNLDRLVWYEIHEDMMSAINKEKTIKSGSRKKKIKLIESINPGWRDLYDDIVS